MDPGQSQSPHLAKMQSITGEVLAKKEKFQHTSRPRPTRTKNLPSRGACSGIGSSTGKSATAQVLTSSKTEESGASIPGSDSEPLGRTLQKDKRISSKLRTNQAKIK